MLKGGIPMGVKQISPGVFQLDFYENRPANWPKGKKPPRHKELFYGDRIGAYEKYNIYMKQLGRETSSDVKFPALCDAYREYFTKNKSSEKELSVIKALEDEFRDDYLFSFTMLKVEQAETKWQKTKSRATVNNRLARLKNMFTKAADWGMVSEAVCKLVHKVKIPDPMNQRERYLDLDVETGKSEEYERLLNGCDEYDSVRFLKPMITLTVNTGMRKEEILSLTWPQVDLKRGMIRLEAKTTKGKKDRSLPLNQAAKNVLASILKRLDVPYVFHHDGERYADWEITKAMDRLTGLVKVNDFHFHDLRHTFASWLMMSGKVTLPALQVLMGHSNIRTTMRYVHLAPNHIDNAVAVLDSFGVQNKNTEEIQIGNS